MVESGKGRGCVSKTRPWVKEKEKNEGASVWGDVATMSLAVVMSGRRPNNVSKRAADRTLGVA